MPTDPHPSTPAPNTLADASKLRAQLDALFNFSRTSGKSIIATEQSRTNTAYGTLTTPDQVASVVLPSDGMVAVLYQALWKESVTAAAQASVFIGGTQLKVSDTNNVPLTQAARTDAAAAVDTYRALTSYPGGLVSSAHDGAAGSAVTTGQVVGFHSAMDTNKRFTLDLGGNAVVLEDVTSQRAFRGGACYAFAAAGTYTVSVQFKASSGSVTAKERKLWVWALGF